MFGLQAVSGGFCLQASQLVVCGRNVGADLAVYGNYLAQLSAPPVVGVGITEIQRFAFGNIMLLVADQDISRIVVFVADAQTVTERGGFDRLDYPVAGIVVECPACGQGGFPGRGEYGFVECFENLLMRFQPADVCTADGFVGHLGDGKERMCAECRRIQPVFVVNITLGIVRFGDAESEVCDGRIICYGAVRLFGVDREERVFGIDREYRIYGNRVGGDWVWRAFRIRRG